MGLQRKHVNELCNDRRNVTAPTALIRALASRTRAGRTCSTADSLRMTCVPATPVGPWIDFCSEVPGVDSLLVGTAKDSLRHRHRLHLVLAQERGYLGEDRLVRPHVAGFGKPSTQLRRLGLRRQD